ncbi:MAG: PilZ domain-containing protein [Bryobacteraceae bacterium]|jgi:hypothetical protein
MPVEDSTNRERRAESRRPAEGKATLWLNGCAVPGNLVDIAKSGFRARYRSPALLSGSIVEFELPGVNGRARVVWTRILGEHVESGFLIVARDTR